MTYSICLTSVDRPYRHHTFQRLVETGTLEHPLVRGFHIAYNRLPNQNTDHVFRQALMDETDWILFLEDDIEIADDFLGSADRWLTDYARPTTHLYPMGCGVRRAYLKARDAGARAWEWPLKEFFGATALMLRPSFVRGFCDLYASPERPDWFVDPTGLDENLKQYHLRCEPTAMLRTPIPCLMDHRGAVSSQTTAEPHWTGEYPGWIGPHATYP